MKRPCSHEIDELAQRSFRNALPPNWVVNKQFDDYGKDYLVETGDEDGELTGSCFYIQLKGQCAVTYSANRATVTFSLESKYAKYYLEKVRDLPVFLVVIDITEQKGWWLFLQPELEANPLTRRRGSLTMRLPIDNDITNTARLRAAIDAAKQWMRTHYPASIHDAVAAHKQRLIRIDPRFDVDVSLVNDKPLFNFRAKQDVSITFEVAGESKIDKDFREMIEKGGTVAFQPGEIKITGSKLFGPLESGGGSIQFAINEKATLALACLDAEGRELADLGEIPGWLNGGQKELHFNGELGNSPLTAYLGPIAEGHGGSLRLEMEHHRWDGQRMQQLAYFERLHRFFQALQSSTTASVECQRDGNTIFSALLPLNGLPFVASVARNLDMVMKARKVVELFQVNPVWLNSSFDRETMRTFHELYGIFFAEGWTQTNPNVRLTANFVRKSFQYTVAEQFKKPESLRMASNVTATVLGENLELGRLVYDFTAMTIDLGNSRKPAKVKKVKKLPRRKSVAKGRSESETIPVVFCGTKSTVMSVRKAKPEDR